MAYRLEGFPVPCLHREYNSSAKHGRLRLLEVELGGQTSRPFDAVKDESADISPVISLVSLQSEQQNSTHFLFNLK